VGLLSPGLRRVRSFSIDLLRGCGDMFRSMEDVQDLACTGQVRRAFLPDPACPVGQDREFRHVMDSQLIKPPAPTMAKSVVCLDHRHRRQRHMCGRFRQFVHVSFLGVAGAPIGRLANIPNRFSRQSSVVFTMVLSVQNLTWPCASRNDW
jgi:hypothetical protein